MSDNIGALWLKEGKKGKFFSGMIEVGKEKISIVVFKNNYKEKENQPDYKILKAFKKGGGQQAPKDNDLPF